MKYVDYVDTSYEPEKDDLICIFYLEPWKCSIKEAAGAVAAESSIGTWTEISVPKSIEKLAAKVFSIKKNIVKIAYPKELFEPGNMPQILSSIAGNIFGMKIVKNLKLLDVHFPKKLVKSFPGPLYGIKGIRKLLRVKKRPLIGTIIKPKLGLNEKRHAQLAYNAWIGGCDIVKDDENLSSQSFNKFEKRVIETLKARDLAEKVTGERKVYMANITAETQEMLNRAEFVKRVGGEYVMVDIMTLGWSALQTLRKFNDQLKLVLHAHRAGHAALTRNPKHGISMLVIAKISRLIGLDQLHIGTIIGKMEGPKKEVIAIDQEIEKNLIRKDEAGHILEQRWFNKKPMFAVCSGGLHPGHVPFLMQHLGNNIIIQFGGGIHAHPNGTIAGARACRQAIEAVMQGKSLEEQAKIYGELYDALEFFKKKQVK
ncbi:MAG: type III ribulose-bisphosphate carboxylase [Candidatus Pacearchaeota archaeon]